MKIKVPNIKAMDVSDVAGIMLVLFLCAEFITACFKKVLGVEDSYYGRVFTIILILFPYILLCILKRRILVAEFWVLYAVIVLFFLATYIMHPEYKYWYVRSDYGVISYVLLPDNGLFIYLILRLVNNPSKIIKYVKYSGWFMYLFYGRALIRALNRGYWIDTSNRGYEIHMSYNLSLGYNILLFVLVFLLCSLEEKKISDYIGVGIGMVIMLLAGSRGPFLDIAIFILLYLIVKFRKSKRKGTFIVVGGIIAMICIFTLPYLLMVTSNLLTDRGLRSRFISKLISGDILDSSGRFEIWSAALNMIKNKPLGYGAMGSRHVIYRYIYVAHPHQIFLEILIDFGVVVGTLIILFLAVISVRLLYMKGMDEWKMIFIVFFARACQLLISLTFWHSIGLWAFLAIWMCVQTNQKKIKIKNYKIEINRFSRI